jgi:hypothetical protein
MGILMEKLRAQGEQSRLSLRRLWSLLFVVTALLFGWTVLLGDAGAIAADNQNQSIMEVSPPISISKVRGLDTRPQIKILSPKADETLSDTTVTVRLQIDNFKPFQDPDLKLGPYLLLRVDDAASQVIYDTNEPITLRDIKPGSHVLRVFANHPWGESYKNPEAYAQVMFNVFTPSRVNRWDGNQPLLTYNQPIGVYGAEPILLDYYLTTPKVLSPEAALLKENLQVRVTVNGQSFQTDRWMPLYLSGFHSGANWIRLELLDQQGQALESPFSEAIEVIQVQSRGQDALSKLVRDELSSDQLTQMVDPVASQRAAKARQKAREQVEIPRPPSPPPKPIVPMVPKFPSPPVSPGITGLEDTGGSQPPQPSAIPTPLPSPKVEQNSVESPAVSSEKVFAPKRTPKPKEEKSNLWERMKRSLPQVETKSSPTQQPIGTPQQPASLPTPVPTISPLPEKATQTNRPDPTKPLEVKPQAAKISPKAPEPTPAKDALSPVEKAKNLWGSFTQSVESKIRSALPQAPDRSPVRSSQKTETPALPIGQSPGSQSELPKLPGEAARSPSNPAGLTPVDPLKQPEKGAKNNPFEDSFQGLLKRLKQAEQQVNQATETRPSPEQPNPP